MATSKSDMPGEDEILHRATRTLESALGGRATLKRVRRQRSVLEVIPSFMDDKRTLLVETVRLASPGRLRMVISRLLDEIQSMETKALLAVPYMSQQAAALCREGGVLFVDLCGNMFLDLHPWLLIDVRGHPNRFQKHHISGAFSKKGSRITRALLCRRESAWIQRELSEAVGLSEGYTSKVVQALEKEGFVRRSRSSVDVIDPGALLEAWRARAKIGPGDRSRVYLWGRTRQEAEHRLALHLATLPDLRFAFTGPSAAYELAPHADYRISGLYISRPLSAEEMAEYRIEVVDEGENLWLIVPGDEGVFQFGTHAEGMPGGWPFMYEWVREGNVTGSGTTKAPGRAEVGIPIVNEVQAYIDLWSFPGRAKEAAEELRRKLLTRGEAR